MWDEEVPYIYTKLNLVYGPKLDMVRTKCRTPCPASLYALRINRGSWRKCIIYTIAADSLVVSCVSRLRSLYISQTCRFPRLVS